MLGINIDFYNPIKISINKLLKYITNKKYLNSVHQIK